MVNQHRCHALHGARRWIDEPYQAQCNRCPPPALGTTTTIYQVAERVSEAVRTGTSVRAVALEGPRSCQPRHTRARFTACSSHQRAFLGAYRGWAKQVTSFPTLCSGRQYLDQTTAPKEAKLGE